MINKHMLGNLPFMSDDIFLRENNPLTSIIILCYNSLQDTTKPCLESILRHTEAGVYEVILVDNASTDGTVDYLCDFDARYAHVTLCLNATNKGFAGGNNEGLRVANGEYIILLNNDTLVMPGWLDQLLRLLRENCEIGLVGPVSNSVGNEQRVLLEGLNETNYVDLAHTYTEGQKGIWFQTEKLGFFCVAMRSTLLKEIGLLDEQFGLGMFEDDDYCLRVKNTGYILAVAEDCFVYHKGSVSFKKLASDTYNELFARNLTLFFKKHQKIWTYTEIAMAIWVRLKIDIIDLIQINNPLAERISVRLTLMDDAIFQANQMEIINTELDGYSNAKHIVDQKHHELMVMSDWASSLKEQNDDLQAQLSEKHKQIVELSDLVSSIKVQNAKLANDLAHIKSSPIYGLMRFFVRKAN